MNTNLVFVIFLVAAMFHSILFPQLLVAQPTNPNFLIDCSSDCVNEAYPYEFCTIENGKATYVTKCSSDPNNEPGFVPYKPTIYIGQICTNMDFESSFLWNASEEEYSAIAFGPVDHETIVFDPNLSLMGCLNAAIREWTKSCENPNNPQQLFIYNSPTNNCCLDIYWSADEREVRPQRNWALGATYKPGKSESSCDGVACKVETGGQKGPRIVLNQSPLWMEVNADGLPKNFFFNVTLDQQTKDLLADGDYIYYSFCTMILHELGHYFGFKHSDQRDSYGQDCAHDGSIMKESLEPYEDANDNAGGPLSENDRCMFRKLYCCQETVTDVADESLSEPVLFDCFGTSSANQVTINVFDIRGANVYQVVIQASELASNTGTLNKDFLLDRISAHVPVGLYFLTVRNQDCMISMTAPYY